MLEILSADVEQAKAKWFGQSALGRWQHSDEEFYRYLSSHRLVVPEFVRSFCRVNIDSIPSRRTGGYSIRRRHVGGAVSWATKLNRFFGSSRFLKLRDAARLARCPAPTVKLVESLAALEGRNLRGTKRQLGISAASKWLMFRVPEVPIFIYDAVARQALGPRRSSISYSQWWISCSELYDPFRDPPLVSVSDCNSLPVTPDWFSRRCLDLALYRMGSARPAC